MPVLSVLQMSHVRNPSFRQPSKELECWRHTPLLWFLSQGKVRSWAVLAWCQTVVAWKRGWRGASEIALLIHFSTAVFIFVLLWDFLTGFWKSHKGILVCISFWKWCFCGRMSPGTYNSAVFADIILLLPVLLYAAGLEVKWLKKRTHMFTMNLYVCHFTKKNILRPRWV